MHVRMSIFFSYHKLNTITKFHIFQTEDKRCILLCAHVYSILCLPLPRQNKFPEGNFSASGEGLAKYIYYYTRQLQDGCHRDHEIRRDCGRQQHWQIGRRPGRAHLFRGCLSVGFGNKLVR